ncbi:NAD(P)-dependent dehydrogenase (short-subunit alcohol dehydrogenase family) [Leucobacter exalbidus]|uniref:NAD(P)-dependent dehydrogenase (Short-subunit alcohol dehydrogenase family) n=1 Tax=Leucobacter exalbidus TaxID=662960 RepID=A0A940PPK6_9MICO|nr:SDR family oxidoreductase [Leucobacter exalbidus]MBP1326830.1 NAD(P)-dependent dehydrogenase (short-subunit alcohol dehydrogenase family) [Leucobacter exalbidus]
MAKIFSSETTVVVTGAARGQGAAHASLLGRPGVRIILTDVLDDEGERTAAVLRSSGADAHYRRLDVTNPDDWNLLAEELRGSDLPLTGLVNNAGILRYSSIVETNLDSWKLHEQVNVHGTFLGIQSLAPLMVANGGGSIVNVSSTAALNGAKGYAAYSASKAAVLALTKVAALEFSPKVRINAICPGGVETPMNDFEPQGGSSSSAPLGRRALVEEISPLIEYLLSARASFVTGASYTIDGGLTI